MLYVKKKTNLSKSFQKSYQWYSSVGKLQCHLLEKSNKATQSKFTLLETGKLC